MLPYLTEKRDHGGLFHMCGEDFRKEKKFSLPEQRQLNFNPNYNNIASQRVDAAQNSWAVCCFYNVSNRDNHKKIVSTAEVMKGLNNQQPYPSSLSC